jgi:hypothetical protein
MKGQQYLADSASMEVHDLDRESARCDIDAVIAGGHDVPYILLVTAHKDGYDNCEHCMKGSLR